MTKSRRIAVLSAYYAPAYLGGGPIRTLEAMVARTPSEDSMFVLTSDRDLGAGERLPVERNRWTSRGRAKVYYASVDSWRAYWRGLLNLRETRPDIVYLNSLFHPTFSILPLLLARLGWFGAGVVILAPRGELHTGALSIRARKKRAFLKVFALFGLHRYVWWHASTAGEAVDIQKRFPAARRLLVREDETLLPDVHRAADAARKPGRLRLVFVGRIVPNKGLDIVLRALATADLDVELDVIGNEENSEYVSHCREIAGRLGRSAVTFRGPLPHEQLRRELPRYDLLVSPTYGENFGHVIPEALSMSIPVFCSAHTPWNELLSTGGGRVIDPNTPESWAVALRDIRGLATAELVSMRHSAGLRYDDWVRSRSSESVFDLLDAHRSSGGRR